ncbi:FGGY carbohydrate kinase domain-containing protein-like isoform X2 [Homarus americanus]|uniref:FGGY carbohydrate kinase domain-containing protein-like isoform X2 n=1 Tax=Homarus americanus TaxID=6706 RepID=UPI001C476A0C|nr:FGGY carbohydrate kinase domain-containing protein-like isoform X2 [Homarus americanus]
MADIYYVGVDVGTSSVRAALVQQHGAILKIHTVPITVNNSNPDFYEQDSGEIWQAVCQSVKDVTCDIKDKTQIHGVGFDATCSLVVLDKDLDPVTVSPATGEDRFNIMMWMDHRAKEQADFINSHDHKSLCSMVCKWTYMCDGQTQGWDLNFFKAIGLEDLADNDWVKIGKEMVAPGTECGRVSAAAALEMGLCESTHVATSVIDAHAGGIALVAAEAKTKQDLIGRLALICGTSTCHMCVSVDPIFAHGVWGPYYSAMIPGYWCAEGGQSATGALVDHVIKTHPAVNKNPDKNVYEWLEGILDEMAEKQSLCSSTFLTKDLHLYPDFHGNRSPLADPSMVGMICGLTLDSSERSLALLYLATLQALAYGTRQIIEQLTTCGHNITSVLMCGGLSNSSLFIQTHADALGVPVLIPQEQQSVLLGASILAATASGDYPDLTAAAVAMGGKARTFEPRKDVKRYHDQKFAVFKKMQSDQKDYKHIMSGM